MCYRSTGCASVGATRTRAPSPFRSGPVRGYARQSSFLRTSAFLEDHGGEIHADLASIDLLQIAQHNHRDRVVREARQPRAEALDPAEMAHNPSLVRGEDLP